MKVLFIGDPHIKPDNHEEVDILIRELKKICEEEKVDRVIIAGDLMHYHERIYTQALNKTLHFINTLTSYCPVDILVGNHDMINNQQFLTSNHWMNIFHSYKNVCIIDKPLKRIENGISYVLCPYVYPGRFIEALNTLNDNWKECDFIFCHQEFKGCKMGSIISTIGDEWKDEYPQIISGHIHDNQKINNIYYPGTPLQHAFGDTDKRVVCMIDHKEIKEIELDVPKKKIIKTTINELSTTQMKLSNSLKIKVKATSEEFKLFKETEQYKECINKGVKIQLEKIEYKEIERTKYDSFHSILHELVCLDSDLLLKKIYNEILK